MITGIIGAMEEEVAKLKTEMTRVIESKKAGMNFLKGKLFDNPETVSTDFDIADKPLFDTIRFLRREC